MLSISFPTPTFFLWFLSLSSLPCSHLLWSKITGSLSEILKPITLTSHCRHSNPLQFCPSRCIQPHPHCLLPLTQCFLLPLTQCFLLLSQKTFLNSCTVSLLITAQECGKPPCYFFSWFWSTENKKGTFFGLACKGKQCTGGCFRVTMKSNINKNYQNSFCSLFGAQAFLYKYEQQLEKPCLQRRCSFILIEIISNWRFWVNSSHWMGFTGFGASNKLPALMMVICQLFSCHLW